MPTAYDLRQKPKETPRQQVRAVVRKPQVLTWLALLSLVIVTAIAATPTWQGALIVVLTWLLGGIHTWLAERVR